MIKYTPEDLESHDGIAAIIKNPEGKVLLQEHVKYGFWTIPVGKVKKGQSIQDALKEEILEECNITIEDYKEITIRNYHYKRNGNMVNVRAHLFEIIRYSGKIKNNEPHKHKQQVFMNLSKVKKLPHLSDLTLLYLKTSGIQCEVHVCSGKIRNLH